MYSGRTLFLPAVVTAHLLDAATLFSKIKNPLPDCLICRLLLVSFLSGSSGIVYVQTVSDIRLCNMKCPEAIGALELYRICRGEGEDPLVEYFCQLLSTKNHNPSRVHLDPSSGCWTLTRAQRSDSCVYNVHHYGLSIYLLSSTDIRVLDPVLITNITSNSSRLGEDNAVSVHYSGEESAVSWELEGERLSDRYRLIDDNRTLIIPSVQRGDAERRFRVTVTNPVSEETREYRLRDNSNFVRMLKEEKARNSLHAVSIATAMLATGVGITLILFRLLKNRRTCRTLKENKVNEKNENIKQTQNRPINEIYKQSTVKPWQDIPAPSRCDCYDMKVALTHECIALQISDTLSIENMQP